MVQNRSSFTVLIKDAKIPKGEEKSMESFASWKINGRRKRERRLHFNEKMSLEEVHHHRRPGIRAWRKKKMNEWRGREEHEI